MSRRFTRQSAFTAIELLIAIFVIALLISILLPSLSRARETANRVKCASNLRQIGMGILMYENDNRGAAPRTVFQGGDKVIPDVTATGADSSDPFAQDSKVPPNCVPSALFLVLKDEDLTSAVFVCPSGQCEPDNYGGNNATPVTRSNFTDLTKNLSYSYANPYPDNGALGAGYKLVAALDPGFAMAADKNPGSPAVLSVSSDTPHAQQRVGNSKNHSMDGQNVLYADGHIEFQTTPLCGLNGDNIYMRGTGPSQDQSDLLNSPKDASDDILLPADGN